MCASFRKCAPAPFGSHLAQAPALETATIYIDANWAVHPIFAAVITLIIIALAIS